MTQPTRHVYLPGQTVLVEAEVVGYEWARPYGAVLVRFPGSTDPSHTLDGVEALLPQAMIHVVGVDVPNIKETE